jgi:hypothetical protein
MNKKDWEKSKDQMQKLLEKGIGELKDLASEASYLTDATTNAVKMELDVHRLRNQLEKAHKRLGREVARTASSGGKIMQTPQVKKLIDEIHSIEEKIREDEGKIKKIPLSWTAAKAAVKQPKAAAKKAPSPKKATKPKKSAQGKKTPKPKQT